MDRKPLIEVRNLSKMFPVTEGFIFTRRVAELKAVDDVSFSIASGETLGFVAITCSLGVSVMM